MSVTTCVLDDYSILRSQVKLATELSKNVQSRLIVIDANSYEAQEWRTAQQHLHGVRQRALSKLEKLPSERKLSEERARHRRSNDALEASIVASILQFVEKLRAEGDFRHARLHLVDLVDVRARLERETT